MVNNSYYEYRSTGTMLFAKSTGHLRSTGSNVFFFFFSVHANTACNVNEYTLRIKQ